VHIFEQSICVKDVISYCTCFTLLQNITQKWSCLQMKGRDGRGEGRGSVRPRQSGSRLGLSGGLALLALPMIRNNDTEQTVGTSNDTEQTVGTSNDTEQTVGTSNDTEQ
jgi:hypothetical protein